MAEEIYTFIFTQLNEKSAHLVCAKKTNHMIKRIGGRELIFLQEKRNQIVIFLPVESINKERYENKKATQ
ncbi:hypothetical protein [Erwinia psidii]|uniref:hypothetical protein n=1 Tax=Erwinia psidii TaxID=69224 RepID=UPI00131581A0|nr:hypothetical protein [Erwinia psidii]